MENKMRIALYMRLSKEDERIKKESNSISNQRLLLRNYVVRHFHQYEITEFVDDGYSGTSLARPAVKSLLEMAKQRKIDCIIVKDFSRFSRDYVEAGSYIEQIFPFLGVRFISVNDAYDSDGHKGNTAGMDQAFKNLMNDLYSKDLSVKVKSSLDSKKKRGIYCSGNCPFGYRKKEDDRHQVEIVEEEAAVIKRIYQMTLDGYTSVEIARQFNKEKIKTPVEFLNARGVTHRKSVGKQFFWEHTAICSILKNEFYEGDIVYGKYEKAAVGGKSHLKPRNEWKIYRNHHEPIIEREVFEAVQRTRGTAKKKSNEKSHPLQGKLVCGGCQKALCIRHSCNPYFYCNFRYVNGNESCLNRINMMLIEQIILFALQKEIKRQINIESMKRQYQDTLQERYADIGKQLQAMQGEIQVIARENLMYYERYVSGEILRDEYVKLKDGIARKKEEVNLLIQEKEKLMEELKVELGADIPGTDETMKMCGMQVLSKDIVELFIKKVTIWDERHVEIIWNFSDSVRNME